MFSHFKRNLSSVSAICRPSQADGPRLSAGRARPDSDGKWHLPMTSFVAMFLTLFTPVLVFAHEVYVLDKATILHDILSSSPNPFSQIAEDPQLFIFWGIIGIILVTTVFAMSISHWFETIFSPFLNRLKPYAAPIARVTLGVCLIASAYNFALFGPELPLTDFGAIAVPIQLALYISGILCLVGLWTRVAGLLALTIFLVGVAQYNFYMFTYANYLGEILFSIILGSGLFSLDRMFSIQSNFLPTLQKIIEPLAFPILRLLFGMSVAFASYFAKFTHSQLALDVVHEYHLTNFFHFEPLFIVLGACIVEILIGIFIAFGFEIRHTALFFLFWIFLSLLYFGESVWPHLVLVGVLLSLFCQGSDRYSVDGYVYRYIAARRKNLSLSHNK